jgi:hypothetical protein
LVIASCAENVVAPCAPGAIALERLHKLGHKGYKPEFGKEFSGAISLRHRAREERLPYNKADVHPDGLVVVERRYGDPWFKRFEPTDTDGFEEFLKGVPKYTFGDRVRNFRDWINEIVEAIVLLCGLIAIVGAIVWSIGWGINYGWKLITK